MATPLMPVHMILSADSKEDKSPSSVGQASCLIFGGEERRGDSGESCSSSESKTSSKLGEAVCQRRCSSLKSKVREILITLIFNKGLLKGYRQRLAPRGVCSSEEAGKLFV